MSWRRARAERFERSRRALAMRDCVYQVVAHYRLAPDLRQQRIFGDWPELVGAQVGARTRPDTIVDRTLIVEVATSSWLHELRLLRPKIVADLLDRLGAPRLFDDIRFVLARDRRGRTAVRRPRPRMVRTPRPAPPPVAATGVERQRILDETARVEDDDLRRIIAGVRIAHDK